MESNWKGTLTASVGETCLSQAELAALKPGDIVQSSRKPGESYALLFNNMPIGFCEAIIFGDSDTFGLRLCAPDSRTAFDVSLAGQDELAELVPVSISLGSIPFDLSEAYTLREGSFINLDTPAKSADNGRLLVAGIELARGTVVVADETMGLRISTLTQAFPRGTSSCRSSGNIADPEIRESAKDFDFSQPECLSGHQLGKLCVIHTKVSRCLGLAFDEPDFREIGPEAKARQLRWDEAVKQLALAGLNLAFDAELSGGGSKQSPAELGEGQTLLYETANCSRPVIQQVKTHLAQAYGQRGIMTKRPVFVFAPAEGSLRDSLGTQAGRAKFLSALSSGWKDTVDFRLVQAPEPCSDADFPYYETVVALSVGRQGEPPTAAIVYPVQTLSPYLRILGQ